MHRDRGGNAELGRGHPAVRILKSCGGPMRWVHAARAPPDIARLLAKHGLAPEPPPERPPVLLGQLALPLA